MNGSRHTITRQIKKNILRIFLIFYNGFFNYCLDFHSAMHISFPPASMCFNVPAGILAAFATFTKLNSSIPLSITVHGNCQNMFYFVCSRKHYGSSSLPPGQCFTICLSYSFKICLKFRFSEMILCIYSPVR